MVISKNIGRKLVKEEKAIPSSIIIHDGLLFLQIDRKDIQRIDHYKITNNDEEYKKYFIDRKEF